ncbi:SRPBCC family protein [Nocardia sp. XZ_19_385]|uniref:SRPBCC family protein n=1 Tax=Nocardia sp. XZ_19_385 TaxID=2769488 RepID=UPI001E4C71A3|nr:SRPBCC family protein [Nocardia sp. XZ_19_385]
MQRLELTQAPAAYACMIVRRPVAEAFRAFADPAVTSRFWYSKSSGPMVAGAELRWEWETYGASADVKVLDVDPDRSIRFEWGNYEQPTTVEVKFAPRETGSTFVEVTETGFQGTGDELIQWVNDTVGGFSTMLCAMKALLEHDLELGAVTDHHPS